MLALFVMASSSPFPLVVEESCVMGITSEVPILIPWFLEFPMRCSVGAAGACGEHGRCLPAAEAYLEAGWSADPSLGPVCWWLAAEVALVAGAEDADGLCLCDAGYDGPGCRACTVGFEAAVDGTCYRRAPVKRSDLASFGKQAGLTRGPPSAAVVPPRPRLVAVGPHTRPA